MKPAVNMDAIELAQFVVACSHCNETLVVQPKNREQGLQCAGCGGQNGPWPAILTSEALPGDDATLRDFIRFSDVYNPLPHYQRKWGDGYTKRVRDLWQACVSSFTGNAPNRKNLSELLMCLQYDIVLGPALGVPDSHKLKFLRWLVDEIKHKVHPSSDEHSG